MKSFKVVFPRISLPVGCFVAILADTASWAAPAQQAYVKASNTGVGDQFGLSVAVSGDTMVVGAYGESSNATGINGNQTNNSAIGSGAVYVFVRDGTNWSQQAYLKASNAEAGDFFGWSVAVSGNTLVVGAINEDSGAIGVNGNQIDNSAPASGAAYVFVRRGANWSQEAYLKASNTESNDFFGGTVAISGDTVVVGAYYESSSTTGINGNESDNSAFRSGAAYVFERHGTNWNQQAYLKASNTSTQDWFGFSVAVSGDTAVVGAVNEKSSAVGVNGNQNDYGAPGSGAAYVFVRNGTNWSQQAYLKASNNTNPVNGIFGRSVAISGDTIVVGANYENSSATEVNGSPHACCAFLSGAAYVFARTGTNWSPQAYLKSSNSEAGDYFGFSAGVSGNTIVVGALHEDSSATGINGNQTNNGASDAGAAYVFVRRGTNWSQQAYLKASNTALNDVFGWSVALSGHTVVVGTPNEDSAATGVNGNQSDNGAGSSGAAYVFTSVGIGPQLKLVADGSGGYFIRFTDAPDVTYRVQRAPSLTGPWDTMATLTAPASGLLEFHDVPPLAGQAFYRTVQP